MAVVSFLFQAEIESDGASRQASEEGAWVVKKDAAYFQARSQFYSLCIFAMQAKQIRQKIMSFFRIGTS